MFLFYFKLSNVTWLGVWAWSVGLWKSDPSVLEHVLFCFPDFATQLCLSCFVAILILRLTWPFLLHFLDSASLLFIISSSAILGLGFLKPLKSELTSQIANFFWTEDPFLFHINSFFYTPTVTMLNSRLARVGASIAKHLCTSTTTC